MENLLVLRLKIETNGLVTFLFQARVHSVTSLHCIFSRRQNIAKHALIICPRHVYAQHELKSMQRHLSHLSVMFRTAEGLQKTTK